MSNITKRELVAKITDTLGSRGLRVTQQEVATVIQAFLDEATETLARGETISLRKFGTFDILERKARIGRNPRKPTKDVEIPARATVKFKPGRELKDKVAASLQIIRERQ